MRSTFAKAATAIATTNYAYDRGCNRLNVLLTINAGRIACDGDTPQTVLRWTMKHLRNFFRLLPQDFAGVWRYEVGTSRYGGLHYHVAFHLPRGIRGRLLEALQRWFDELIDEARSSKSFKRPKWQVVGVRNG
jgi:hypothetical protein